MTKEQFDLKYRGEKVAVHCDTEEKAKAFLSLAKSFGYKWSDGRDLDTGTFWINYKDDLCFSMDYFLIGFIVGGVEIHKQEGYKIVEFELDEPNGYAIEDTPSPMKETFNVGDVVYDKDGEKLTIKRILYMTEDFNYYEEKELSRTKPLTKITKEQLAEMGYEVKE